MQSARLLYSFNSQCGLRQSRMLSQKTALITGASSGIGSAIARIFAAQGASLILSGRNENNLENVKKECSANNQEHLVIPGDLNKPSDVSKVAEQALEWKQKIDILVNNAGILEKGSIEETTMDQYDRVMDTNMRAVYQLTTLLVPQLIQSKGNIVNVSSVNGIRSFPGVLAYNVSKAALDQFTRCVALELAPHGVRVNSVNPGVTVTELHKTAGLDTEAYDKFLEHSKTTHALGRVGRPEEVASVTFFLASEQLSSFITGACIPVDGGRHAMCPR